MSTRAAGPSVRFRRASASDLPGEHAAFVAAQEELHNRRGAPWPGREYDPSGMWAQVQLHLLAHDGERSFVAEAQGQVAGFTAAMVRGDFWYFSALFVHPRYQGRGLGRHLLELAWDGPFRRRATITEAIQPVSTGLYAQRGLLPVTPVLGFSGCPTTGDGSEQLEPAVPAPGALREVDLAAYGFDRSVDHELWARTSARATLWLRAGEPCAYSYCDAAGNIGPVAGSDPASAAEALRAELAYQAGRQARVDIPGTATAMVKVALEAGLRLGDPGLLLLSPPDRLPTSYAVHSYWLL